MDLFVVLTIVVVFLVLLAASLLVNKMPSGKTFEEVQREKKQLADQMKQQTRPAKQKGGGGNSQQAAKKGKKGAEKKSKQQQATQESHVEFADEEPIVLSEDMPVAVPKKEQPAAKSSKKSNKNNNKAGILVNKGEQQPAAVVMTKPQPEKPNHFEEILPKDDIEMLKVHQQKADEPKTTTTGKLQKNAVNELRKEKKAKKTGSSGTSTPTGNQNGKSISVPQDVADIEGVEQILRDNVQKLQKMRHVEAGDAVRVKKGARGADNSLQVLQRMVEGTDEISVNMLIMLLAKAELSRPEIQVVIDYLLNKQSDSGAVIKSEWTEGKQDLVARLKKQLAEREEQAQNEREAAAAFQEKLKLLRLELNAERAQNGNTAKMYMWEMGQKEKEMEVLVAKVNAAGAEKTALVAQMQKASASLQRELELYKSSVQGDKVELRNLQNELDSARNEILQMHQKHFESSEQVGRDVQVLSSQVTQLQIEVAQYEAALKEKNAQLEALEAEKGQSKGAEDQLLRELAERKQETAVLRNEMQMGEKATAQYELALKEKDAQLETLKAEKGQSKGAEDTLLRELAERKQEMAVLRTEMQNGEEAAAKSKALVEEYKAERDHGKATEEGLLREMEELKQKNNDLRTTNWKLMEAVTVAEKATAANANNEIKLKKEAEAQAEQRAERAEKELRDKFTQMLTQISVFSNLKLDNGHNGTSTTSNGGSSSGPDLDAWMARLTGDLKKKLDVYESLLGTLRQQLQDKREKEQLQAVAGNAKVNSAKFLSEASSNGTGDVTETNGASNGAAKMAT